MATTQTDTKTTTVRIAGTTFLVNIDDWADQCGCARTAKAIQKDVREHVVNLLTCGAVPLVVVR